MTELHYDDHDTKEITLPRQGSPAQRRTNFIEAPAPPPPFSREASLRKPSVFEPVLPRTVDGPKQHESLMIGDVLHVPVPAYDENSDTPRADAFRISRYTVKEIIDRDGVPMARAENDASRSELIPANSLIQEKNETTGRDTIEADIAKRLLEQDGVDIHSPDVTIIEDASNQASREER